MMEHMGEKLGEFELIQWIREQVRPSQALVQGIGDDCSIEDVPDGYQLLTSTDLLIEDVHFKRAWTTMFDLGRKAAAVNLSDIAAMGGEPQSLYLGIGRPKTIGAAQIKDFIRGFLKEASDFQVDLAGGDTCASPGPLLIAVVAHGRVARGQAVRRDGAGEGDAVYVSGTLGDSALALQLLQQGQQPCAALAERFHTPTARIGLAAQLAGEKLTTAMLDISDGLLADLQHILDASGVGADLDLDRIPLSQAFQKAVQQEITSVDTALAGGEEYELLFTSATTDLSTREDFYPQVTRIGTITRKPGLRVLNNRGEVYHSNRSGFDHFLS